jgi:hypothetical protein
MVVIHLTMQQVPFTTKIVSSNSAHGDVYSIQQNMTKFVRRLQQVGGFLVVCRFSPPIKTERHNITEILLKAALNTITASTLFNLHMHGLIFPTLYNDK